MIQAPRQHTRHLVLDYEDHLLAEEMRAVDKLEECVCGEFLTHDTGKLGLPAREKAR